MAQFTQFTMDTKTQPVVTNFNQVNSSGFDESVGADDQGDCDTSGTVPNGSAVHAKTTSPGKSASSEARGPASLANGKPDFLLIDLPKKSTIVNSIDVNSDKSDIQVKRSSLELKLNDKTHISSKPKLKVHSIYANPIRLEDAKETDIFLKHGIAAREEDRPILHVQFDNENKTVEQNSTSKPSTPSSSLSSSSSSSSSEESLEISETHPPDGGWGWVVVAASFLVNLIADGVTFSFGVIFVEFVKYFGENHSKTAWIGSLFMAMPLLSGPIASFLTDRYGCRKVTILGSILATAGFVISTQANSVQMLFLTFGILAGFGLSLCYVASVVIVAYYFDKRRSFATGLAVCGSGIGTCIFAPLTQWLIDEFGWRGATLILGGLFLNLAVCGALMRDLPWTTSQMKLKAKERKLNRRKARSKGSSADSFSVVSNSTNTASALQPIIETREEESSKEELNPDRLCSSLVNLPTYVKNGEKVPIEVIELLSTHKNVYNVLMQNYPSLLTPSRSFSDSGRLNEVHLHHHNKLVEGLPQRSSSPPPRHANTDEAYLWWLKRNHITPPRMNPHKKLQPAYLKDLRVHRLSLTYRGAMLNINRYRLRASSCPDIYRNSMTTIAKEKNQWYAGLWDFWDLLVDMFDMSHFADKKFLLFSISNFLLYTWYDVPYVFLADYANKIEFSQTDSSRLISIIGIVNMVGEIILGWAGDRSWINAGIIYAFCMCMCGLFTALVPLFRSYTALGIVSGAFGLFIAANYSLTCIILVEVITLERFTNAYGLLLLVQGIANLIGPPLAGWIYDITGSYDLPFYLAGLFIALSGLLLVIMPATKRYKHFQTLQRQLSSEDDLKEEQQLQCHVVLVSCITGQTGNKKPVNKNHV